MDKTSCEYRALKNKIISVLIPDMVENIDDIMPEQKRLIEDYVKENNQKEIEIVGTEAKERLKRKEPALIKQAIRQRVQKYLQHDFDFMADFIGVQKLSDAKEDELKELFTFVLKLRNDDLSYFYRMDKATENGVKSLHAHIKKGSLNYNYEKLCVELMKKWSDANGRKIVSDDEVRNEYMVECLENIKLALIDAFVQQDRYEIQRIWKCLIEEMEVIYQEVCSLEKKQNNLMVGIWYLDVVSGVIRDVLILLMEQEQRNLGDFDESRIVNSYIKTVSEQMAVWNDENDGKGRYLLFIDYLLNILMISLREERAFWIEAGEFLLSELELDVKTKREKYKVEEKKLDSKKIVKWFREQHAMFRDADESILEKAVYTECFIYKSLPEMFSRKKIRYFLNYIDSEQAREPDNMTEIEYFYFEKIIRGIARENNNLDFYKKYKTEMNRIYKLEEMLFRKEHMTGEYLGKWIQCLVKGFEWVGVEYRILFW